MPRSPRALRAYRTSGIAVLLLVTALTLGGHASQRLMWVITPTEGSIIGLGGVEVEVRYPDAARVASETLRVLLNGADVTGALTSGSDGAHGRLYGVLNGENVLSVGVVGRRGELLPATVTESHEIRVLVRIPQDIDRG